VKIQLLVSRIAAVLTASMTMFGADTAPADFPSMLGGPVLGFIWEQAPRLLRPILGIPGASLLADPIPLDFEAATAAVSPGRDFLLAFSSSGELYVIRIRDRQAQISRVEGFNDPQANIVMSPTGAAALIYTPGGGHILTGLPEQPSVRGAVSLASLPGELGPLAVADDGAALLAAASNTESDSLFLLSVEREPQALPIAGRASLVAFQAGTHHALLADRQNDQIAEIRNASGTPEYRTLAGPAEGIAEPVGLAASADNRMLFVASARTSTILALDLQDGTSRSVTCNCALERLEPLNGKSLFRVNEGAGVPLWLFDGSGAELRFVFVPAPAKSQQEETPVDQEVTSVGKEAVQ
jgi:hypothetical protein